mgnify:CR=1 FL=1
MKELDCVRLVKPFKDLPLGAKGVVVLKYNDEDVEVEFFDENDQTIDVYTIPTERLEVTWEAKLHEKYPSSCYVQDSGHSSICAAI